MSSLGWPLLSLFSWPMQMAARKANQETTRARQGMLDEADPLMITYIALLIKYLFRIIVAMNGAPPENQSLLTGGTPIND